MRKWRLPALEEGRLQAAGKALFPLCFVLSSTLNLVFFYLGLAFEDNFIQKGGFILGSLLLAACCGLALLCVLQKRLLSPWSLLLLGAVLAFYGVCFAVCFARFGFRPSLVRYFTQFAAFSLPAFFAGIYAAARGGGRAFFPVLESASFAAFPGALIYMNSTVFNCLPWGYGANLGILNYMGLAYTFLPYLLAHVIQFVDGADWTVPFTGKAVRRPQLVRGVFIAVYWMALIASATRGAYVCVVFFCLLLPAARLLTRSGRAKRACLVCAAMVGLLLFNMFVYAPPGLYRVSRMNLFLDALKQGHLMTTSQEDNAASRIDDLVRADGGQQIINLPGTAEPGTTEPGTTEPGTTEPVDIASEGLKVENRGTLFKLAIREFLKSPLTGMGPGGFTVKYGMYPHTVLLELLCETGLAGTLPLLALLLLALCKMVIISKSGGGEFGNSKSPSFLPGLCLAGQHQRHSLAMFCIAGRSGLCLGLAYATQKIVKQVKICLIGRCPLNAVAAIPRKQEGAG